MNFPPMFPSSRRPARGFTLVELLVVIGIIALLMSILLPTLGRVKEQANKIKCGSNIRQIAMGFTMYLQANADKYPRGSSGSVSNEDWIYWQSNRVLEDSRITPYVTSGGSSTFPEPIFQCPSDDVMSHLSYPTGYRFSYTVNWNICKVAENPAPNDTLKGSKVRSPAHKILIVEESSETIDDGCWARQESGGGGKNVVSARHDRSAEKSGDLTYGYTNAGYCDGHVEWTARADTFKPEFYDPYKNP